MIYYFFLAQLLWNIIIKQGNHVEHDGGSNPLGYTEKTNEF